ncbi:hypothetical protein [Methanobrevibacter sp.]|uniref:hypothetical protein n=1 Tax=Methanobrevibacter sp. TaxID=66852 RepID=UPI0038904125
MTRRNEGKIALIMILALIAFVVGSAIGISVSMNEQDNATADNNNTTHVENVTVEMTSNLNNKQPVEFDYETDYVDYNENYTNQQTNID